MIQLEHTQNTRTKKIKIKPKQISFWFCSNNLLMVRTHHIELINFFSLLSLSISFSLLFLTFFLFFVLFSMKYLFTLYFFHLGCIEHRTGTHNWGITLWNANKCHIFRLVIAHFTTEVLVLYIHKAQFLLVINNYFVQQCRFVTWAVSHENEIIFIHILRLIIEIVITNDFGANEKTLFSF